VAILRKVPCGVATISRLLKIIGLFGRISSLFKGSFTKETYNFKGPTNHSHPIWDKERSVFAKTNHEDALSLLVTVCKKAL